MNPNSLKPINVMCEQGVSVEHEAVVTQAIELTLEAAGVERHMPIRNLGNWRKQGYRRGSGLVPYMSADWYVGIGRRASERRGQIESHSIFEKLIEEPWQQDEPHYDVLILKSDLYFGDTNFVLGAGSPCLGLIISLNRFLHHQWRVDYREVIETVTMHELAHVFGVPAHRRTTDVEFSLGKHCTNRCVMRQRLELDGWNGLTRDRLRYGAFCQECRQDLQAYFADYQPRSTEGQTFIPLG